MLSRRLFNAHLAVAAAGTLFPWDDDPPPPPAPDARIAALHLQTAQPLAAMREFYTTRLGFAVASEAKHHITFRAGSTALRFAHTPDDEAIYHFAFNIPENRIREAHTWLAQRTPLIMPPKRFNDQGLAPEIVAFRHWDAHSLFFWDPAGNAVELIARHTLKNATDEPFSLTQILGISEIGLVTDDVPKLAATLKQSLSLRNYSTRSDAFEALGDENGLLLCFKEGRKMAFDQGGVRKVVPTGVTLRRPGLKRLDVEGLPIVVRGG